LQYYMAYFLLSFFFILDIEVTQHDKSCLELHKRRVMNNEPTIWVRPFFFREKLICTLTYMAIHHFLCLICPATLAARRQDTYASETLRSLSASFSKKLWASGPFGSSCYLQPPAQPSQSLDSKSCFRFLSLLHRARFQSPAAL